MKRRWTEKEINRWYHERDWINGFNFIPSGSMNGCFWLLQEYGHEDAFRDASREIALASSIGMNSIRFYLPFDVWWHQRDAFFAHLDELLDLLEYHGMTMMPVIFNDCSDPRDRYQAPEFGPQPEPVPGQFGGTSGSAFDDDVQSGRVKGYVLTDEVEMRELFEEYVRSLASRYGNDSRINIWNVWNEIGNSSRGSLSVPMMEKTFEWLRDSDVEQPLTAEVWGGGAADAMEWVLDPVHFPEPELRALDLSDIVSFHYYGDYSHARMLIDSLRPYGRPLINTEWMHRPYRSLIQTHLPLWQKEDIGSYFFGFVNGKTQFNHVWEFIKPMYGIDTRLWMHDIFHSDFTAYDPEEIEVLRQCGSRARRGRSSEGEIVA